MPKITTEQGLLVELMALGCHITCKPSKHGNYYYVEYPESRDSETIWLAGHLDQREIDDTLSYYRSFARGSQ